MKPTLENGERRMLRHAVATLAYRGAKTCRGAPPEFAAFRADPESRSPVEIVAHMGDLFDWACHLAEGKHIWNDSKPQPWDAEVARFFAALARFERILASDVQLGFPEEKLFQGPVADALTHVGQLAMLRRLSGAKMRGENYFKAEIVTGRVGPEQAAPVREW